MSTPDLNIYAINFTQINNLSTGGQNTAHTVPFAGTLIRAQVTPTNELSPGGNDATVDVQVNGVSVGSVVLPAAETNTNVGYFGALRAGVAEGDVIDLITDGGSTNSIPAHCAVLIKR